MSDQRCLTAGADPEPHKAAGRGAVPDPAPALLCAEPTRRALLGAPLRERPADGALAEPLQGALSLQALQSGAPGAPHWAGLPGLLQWPDQEVHTQWDPALVGPAQSCSRTHTPCAQPRLSWRAPASFAASPEDTCLMAAALVACSRNLRAAVNADTPKQDLPQLHDRATSQG